MPGSTHPAILKLASSLACAGTMDARCISCATMELVSMLAMPAACLALSSACIPQANFPAPASGWRRCSASFAATAAKSGRKLKWRRARFFISPCNAPRIGGRMNKVILLVEDNPDDEALTLRALKKNNVTNEVVVARDGVEALDYLFGTGTYANRDVTLLPQIVILDLKLPKIDGLEVLRRMRAAPQTKLLPVVILTS